MTTVALDLETMLPATFTATSLSEKRFIEISNEFPDAIVEYDASEGTIIVMPATDPNTGKRHWRIIYQLGAWQIATGRGEIGDSSTGFLLPNGSRRSPDACWYDAERWKQAPVFAPEFVIEVRSPSDRIRPLREKMEEYIANGVRLGWLIDPKEGKVVIYCPGREPQVLDHPFEVAGDGPMEGFVLK